jgi:hypothetical protein
MSAAIARKRRAEVNQNNIPNNANRPGVTPPTAPTPGTGLTLPQVISVIDTRLIVLETFMKETKNTTTSPFLPSTTPAVTSATSLPSVPENNEIMEEMDTRFDILAREIADLKDIVLKLQAYTMDVNKTLLEERIHILSDLDQTTAENSGANFALSENASASMT